MSDLPPPPPPPPPGGRGQAPTPQRPPQGQKQPSKSPVPKWTIWIALGIVAALLFGSQLFSSSSNSSISYSEFLNQVEAGQVTEVKVNNNTAVITGETRTGDTFATTGPNEIPQNDLDLMAEKDVKVTFVTPQSNWFVNLIPLLLPVALLIGFFIWMQRRAAGQMGNVMSIGRSRAKAYTADKPSTTFGDIAGYEGVKMEIKEVVDFLRMPDRFKEIGARVPKGILLVGPPGTGKTLFARAVAGEAGVGFLSVTGSDFMEMFVGVGASRVRDLFQTARKMGRAIIFIDEIDSIGRKRGAGLGGGHDEREQTLNQMLAEMDGFETAEGIVIMAATNRPDILDPALLRPGRFDRQIVVPLPEFDERLGVLKVHCRDKQLGPDVDLETMAKGTPGMSGADLANLVNEAALFAVRRGSKKIERIDFENARDRIIMGARRESLVLSPDEKRTTAYHEGGHAVLAAVLPHGDPVHKVTILPTGMALGVTQTMPEERHSYSREYIEDRLCMALGGRVAEELVFGQRTTGAADDLNKATSWARRMVKEWGMSDRIGPMAWESHQHVFLGEDLMQGAREYSDDTARLVDEETSRILREQEDRARQLLTHHRRGLDLVARALLDEETVEGAKVVALVAQGLSEQQPVPGLPVSHPSQLAGHPTQLASHPTQLASGTTAPGGPLPPPAV